MSRWSRRDEKGMVAVLVAISLLALLGVAALSLDGGNARQMKRKAQSSVDAAALAGLQDIMPATTPVGDQLAVATVKRYTRVNMGIEESAWNGCDAGAAIPAGWHAPDGRDSPLGGLNNNNCILIRDRGATLRITHLPTTQVGSIFGHLIGVDNIAVSAKATATASPTTYRRCALCVIGTGTPLNVQNGQVTVSAGEGVGIGVNGSGYTANNGYGAVQTDGLVTFYNNGIPTGTGDFRPGVETLEVPLPDPLASLGTPNYSSLPRQPGCVLGVALPGIYDSIPINCVLTGGLYVITGPTHVSGNDSIIANPAAGVTFYMTCNTGGNPRPCTAADDSRPNAKASLRCSGNATIQMRAPTVGPYRGIVLYFDRMNNGEYHCSGNGSFTNQGTVYGARATHRMDGNAGCNHNGLIVMNRFEFNGNNATCNIVYNEVDNVQLPPVQPGLID